MSGFVRGDGSSDSEQDAEFLILRLLARSPCPLGAWKIQAALAESGLQVSEATVGRILRNLDRAGCTGRIGVKGRTLTQEGHQRVAELELVHRRTFYHDSLSTAVSPRTTEDLLDLLRARRLIEAETARLAAINATEAEVVEIERAVEEHISATYAGKDSVDNNHRIHNLIASASHSPVYQAIVNLFNQDRHLHDTQYQIQLSVGGVDPEVHRLIAAAIRDRDPDEAAASMRHHIDLLIQGCRATYVGDAK